MEIKGMIFHSRKDFVISHSGEEAWHKVVESLPAEDQEMLGDLILTASWYPFEVGERLDKAIVAVLGNGDTKIFKDIGIQSARSSLLKVHKTFI
ncbi:MAG TPA: hypothetical protein VLA34_12870, partial [Candidatus Krumholzibacterium sp.]|nr:hypothetical protein [Candidatus Krumholzibacterium sp.]